MALPGGSTQGFYLMYRGWQDNPVFASEPFSRRDAWCWLIEAAAFAPTKTSVSGKTIVVERGQVSHAYRFLAAAWGWSLGATQRFIARLETETMINTKCDTGRMVITICNYDRYQLSQAPADTKSGTGADTRPIHDRYTIDTEKNEGKELKERKIPTTSGPEPDPSPPVDLLGQPIAVSLGAVVFNAGLKVLLAGGVSDRQARALLGKWRKEVGDAQLIELLETAERSAISEPVAWIAKAISTRQAAASEDAGYGAADARKLYADLGVAI